MVFIIGFLGFGAKKQSLQETGLGDTPLIALTTGASAALKSHIIICKIVQCVMFQCVVKHTVLGRKGAAFNLSENSLCVGNIVKMGNDAFVNYF